MKEQNYIELRGCVESITFSSQDTGFTVLDLSCDGELICVVGQINTVVGEELILTGYYQTHNNYGLQFKVQMYEKSLPSTSNAIRKYLAGGVVKGIGPVIAKKIVDKFGEDTLKVIEQNPEKLAEVSGITKAKADKLSQEFKQVFGVRALMIFLSKYSINPMHSVLIWKKWGVLSLDRINENPYIICGSDIGIDFQIADLISDDIGIKKDSYIRITAAISFVLSYNVNNGHTCLPKAKLISSSSKLLQLDEDKIDIVLDDEIENKVFFCVEGNVPFIFLSSYYYSQSYIVNRIKEMILENLASDIDCESIINDIEKTKSIEYERLQKKAIVKASKNNIFILTGGPGTGKTTTLNGIIEVLEHQNMKVLIAAPTGRAAKRISEMTGKEAKTIHRMLEVGVGYSKTGQTTFLRNQENPLEADVVVVDEMSMVDTLLFESLLKGIKKGGKIIMVGDFNQLPSVGPGNILRDLIESDFIEVVKLEQIFRQAAQSLIVTNAHSIVHGEVPDLSKRDNDFFFLEQNNIEQISNTILDLCSKRLTKSYGFSPFEDIQVLCPGRKGDIGTIELNKKLQDRLNKKSDSKSEYKGFIYNYRSGDKVMQVKNNYDIVWNKEDEKGTGIFNGDIGIIKMIDKGSQTMSIDFDGRITFYTFEMVSEQLELAYAITVHKSQGSEFEAIILPIIGGYDKLYFRNLLYTAVTRAKQILIIIGKKTRVEFMIKNNIRNLRYTALKLMLNESIIDEN